MEMPKASDGHRKLEKIAGRWEGEETMYPSPWDPKGGKAIGRINSRVALNGFAVINNYEQERDGAITFTGHGVFTYDPKADVYSLSWFDCMGVLRMAHGGPGMHVRLAYDLSEPGSLLMSMEMSPDGTAWNRLFDGYLKRLT